MEPLTFLKNRWIFFFLKNCWFLFFADVTLAQRVRAIFFYLTTLVIAVPLFVVMLALQPFVLLLDKQRRRAQHLVNKVSPFIVIVLSTELISY